MRAPVLMLGCALAAAPAGAQGLGVTAGVGDTPITVTTRVRHVTTVVLPEATEIVDVIVGDAEYWDVSAAAHLAFVRPLVEDARSNLVLLTAAGSLVPMLVVERADAAVDAVVRVGEAPEGSEVTSFRQTAAAEPVLASAAAVETTAARVAAAWESVAAAEKHAAERAEAARTAARERLDAKREAYPRQARFDYRWPEEAARYPWLVEAMWHDGRRTFLRTRAISPRLHERVKDGALEPVAVAAVLDDVLHVVPRVLGDGALEVGGRRLPWTVAPRKAGP